MRYRQIKAMSWSVPPDPWGVIVSLASSNPFSIFNLDGKRIEQGRFGNCSGEGKYYGQCILRIYIIGLILSSNMCKSHFSLSAWQPTLADLQISTRQYLSIVLQGESTFAEQRQKVHSLIIFQSRSMFSNLFDTKASYDKDEKKNLSALPETVMCIPLRITAFFFCKFSPAEMSIFCVVCIIKEIDAFVVFQICKCNIILNMLFYSTNILFPLED